MLLGHSPEESVIEEEQEEETRKATHLFSGSRFSMRQALSLCFKWTHGRMVLPLLCCWEPACSHGVIP